ncbi:STAS domain-containing protein [Oscillatoria sp. FACHB-1407]|uniref:STAS domain-containing protein n=1 Tax=Oscillatoria sp. FACHB-1407 TaxID=2692847 RepID=UPI00168857DC|nr:STAS domain-containing protein [Oscillatoria sp. FACHB-1407]MBD2465441.1 STAS domain-containing protein [Oscillatoria sp. FACHB-1407]
MSTINVFLPTRILSSANAPDLLNWIRDCLEKNRNHLLINLKNVLFMDSIGLTALITARGMVLEAGGKLGVCGLTGQARMLFEMTNMERVFEIYETAVEFQQAIEQLRTAQVDAVP